MSGIRSQATPAPDELADVIHVHVCANNVEDCTRECHLAAAALQSTGWSKPRTVTSAAELDALPFGSVIRSEDVTALKARNGAWLWDDGNYWEPLAGREVRVLFAPGDAG
ncbi:hypothetical protein [Rhodococcus erythropolis]|uniref:Uncharacterized protein n=1 Tax=Rhodococcus erythropolis (strain PR4 / NBRC 100887) TaxID=234621 RepID=C0ZXA6_RHOE4|nr:hypothetical protein [Rhodococcus erythropolis]BAH32991.1 hypothetical protein RER_22830 [Rhodococcus erythropolis PR4]